MASVQARHSRSCPSGKPWTPIASLDGCNCGPTFYVVVREGAKVHRERVGKNARNAERALTQIQAQVDTDEYVAVENIRFRDWADKWIEESDCEETTKRSYRQTLAYAKEAFGDKLVRHLRPKHIKALNTQLRQRGLSASTRNRHLRALNTCLNAAVPEYAARNPIAALKSRPRPAKREAAYFLDEELPRLFAALPRGVYRVLFLVALKTGMRQGELLALTWADVDLNESLLHVRNNFTDGILKDTKTHERREVDLTADVVELLGKWWGECGGPGDAELVFPGGGKGGHLPGSNVVCRQLYRAMKRAGIAREGESGEKRTFHSFRHTYAKIALENGALLFWLSRQLGHSSPKVTTDIYGHWERAKRKEEAKVMEGVFGV